MTDREVMQQALEALLYGGGLKKMQAIAALRARLAEPEPEPKAVADEVKAQALDALNRMQSILMMADGRHPRDVLRAFIQLASMPVARLAEPEPDPVAWMVFTQDGQSVFVTDNPTDIGDDQRALPLYTAPPSSPLTREQAIALWADKSDGPSNGEIVSFARAIERAHKITGGQQ